MPNPKKPPVDIDAIVRKAKIVQVGPDIYSNYQHVTATVNEMYIDFYSLSPDPANNSVPVATFLQRIVLPIVVGLELGQVIQQAAKNAKITVSFDPDTIPQVSMGPEQENK